MPNEITFPDSEPRYDFDRDCLSFSASKHGELIEVLVSSELLVQRFGSQGFSEPELREAFHEHRIEIQDIARHHIEMGWISTEGKVILTTRFTRLDIVYGERLRSEGTSCAEAATKLLAEIIGPTGGKVTVLWDRSSRPFSHPEYSLTLSDTSGTVEAIFDYKELLLLPSLRFRLAYLWDQLLQIRSRKMILKSG